MKFKVGDRVRLRLTESVKNEEGREIFNSHWNNLEEYLIREEKLKQEEINKPFFIINHIVMSDKDYPYCLEGIREVRFSEYDLELIPNIKNPLFKLKGEEGYAV